MDSSKFHTIRLSLFILNALRQGTHQTAIAFSSIGISPPWGSPTAAIFGCDGSITLDFWLNGSIIIPSACHRRHWICLSMSESWRYIKYVRSCGLSVPNSRRKVSDVLIFYFQRTMPALFLASIENRQKRNNPFHLFPHLKAKTHP